MSYRLCGERTVNGASSSSTSLCTHLTKPKHPAHFCTETSSPRNDNCITLFVDAEVKRLLFPKRPNRSRRKRHDWARGGFLPGFGERKAI